MSKVLCIFGAGGHARSVADVVLSSSPSTQIIFVDKSAIPNEKIFGFDVKKTLDIDTNQTKIDYFVAIGDNKKRETIIKDLDRYKMTNIISGDSYVGKDVIMGSGVFIGHQAYVGPLVRIGNGVIINTRAVIEHEVEIGSGSQIAPNVTIGGRTRLGENIFIGLNATIIDNVTVCSNVTIGASAVVVDNIVESGTYVGIPARKTR